MSDEIPTPDVLTARQYEVAQRIADGWPRKRIERDLGISTNTIRFHIDRIVEQLPNSDLPPARYIGLWFNHWRWTRQRVPLPSAVDLP